MLQSFKRFLSTRTPKFYFLQKAVNGNRFRLLDVGSGNHSPSKTVKLFPNCEYYGLDLERDAHYNEADNCALRDFYQMDLTTLEYERIPEDFFDYIQMAHVIEHLHNGDEVLKGLAAKLRSKGHIYIEYPGKTATKLPSMGCNLNFYDDKTHVRVYSTQEIASVLRSCGFTVIASGTRRSWYYISLMPVRALGFLIKGKKMPSNILWDVTGFAEYVYAVKN